MDAGIVGLYQPTDGNTQSATARSLVSNLPTSFEALSSREKTFIDMCIYTERCATVVDHYRAGTLPDLPPLDVQQVRASHAQEIIDFVPKFDVDQFFDSTLYAVVALRGQMTTRFKGEVKHICDQLALDLVHLPMVGASKWIEAIKQLPPGDDRAASL